MSQASLLLCENPQDGSQTQVTLAMGFFAMVMLALSGCGLTINNPAFGGSPPAPSPSPTPADSSPQIHGHVGGAEWSVSASSLQLYSVGTQGTASSASPLLAKAVETDTSGNFVITGGYACPSPTAQLYLVASGGNPGLASGTNNKALSLMTMLGPCGQLSSTAIYPVNEVTTVGSIWPLSSFMASVAQLGSSPGDASFTAAMSRISQLINLGNAVSPGTGVPSGYAVQTAKLYTLSDDLHGCTVSRGGTAGDGSACGQLFSLATAPGIPAPTNTIDAALSLARVNQLSVDGLFQFLPADAPFQPILPDAPTDWNLDLVPIPAAPTFTPASGTYASGQQITLSSSTKGATLRYSLDGSPPSATSPVYDGPFMLSSTETVRAIAQTEDIDSAISSATFSINKTIDISIAPLNATLSASQSQLFTAKATGTSNTNVTWKLNPAIGTISATGLYTSPSSITSQQTVTVSATSNADPTKTACATVTLNPPPAVAVIAVSVAPASLTLAPAQSRQFTAMITGTSQQSVVWTLNTAVGTISATGLYTAPASIIGLQNVIVTATSTADPTKAASANVSITPAGSAYLIYYVDNVGGSDANNGTSVATPFATIAKVNTLDLLPGQTVAFKTGDVWHEMLTISHSGSHGLPINYTSYGSGQQPVIDASDTVTGWKQGGSASSSSLPTYVWSHPQRTNPLLINFAGQTGIPVSNRAAISAPKQFAWDGSTLYVYSNTDPTSIVEVAAQPSALTSAGASYITVSNLELRGGTDIVFCGVARPCANWDFESNTIDSGYGVGLRWALDKGVSGAGLTVNGNTFRGTGSSGIGLGNGGSAMGDIFTNNTMTDLCKVFVPGSSENAYCDAMNLFSQTGTDGGGRILNNTISEVGLTSGAAYGGGIHPDTVVNWDIEDNRIFDTNYPGIELEKGSGSVARYNLLVNTGQYRYFAGLFIRAGDGLSVSNMVAEYNTIVGGFWACALGVSQNSGAVTATNIVVSRNICTGATSGTQLWLDPGFLNTGNSFSTNGFGIATPAAVEAGNVSYGSSQLPSSITGSIWGDPQFVNPAARNYSLQPTSPDIAIGAFPKP
jgi:Chitobiase/beta-hexosaminidase C-terminal domain/Right handed beta helix region/Bacterial Ig-like domain (group 2)